MPITAIIWDSMIKSKHIDKICLIALVIAIILAIFIMSPLSPLTNVYADPLYKNKLFDDTKVHDINIIIDDFKGYMQKEELEEYVKVDVEIDGERINNVGFRAKGNNSLNLTQEYDLKRFSFKIEFDHYTDGNYYYGLDKLSLDASFQDNSYLKSYLAYDMLDYLEVPTPLTSFARLHINNEYWGLYLAIEEIEDAFLKRNYGLKKTNLYKPDYRSLNDQNDDLALIYLSDDPDDYPNIFSNAVTKINKEDKTRLIEILKRLSLNEDLDEIINSEEVISYFIPQIFMLNWDSYIGPTGHNYYLLEKDGMIEILPWDYNLAFGTYALGMSEPIKDSTVLINYPINTPYTKEIMLKRPLYHIMMQNEEYLLSYHERFEHLIEGYFKSGRYLEVIDNTVALIRKDVKNDPSAFVDYDDFILGVDTLKEFCRLRSLSIEGQLNRELPITHKEISENPDQKIDASHLIIEDLGDFDDLRYAKSKDIDLDKY